ncbi:MAG: cellulase family glycosylhydrolase [Chloroflexi bacterium]|nr:cellulase family glycosylhydrolase [Chloroflexota bacterium]
MARLSLLVLALTVAVALSAVPARSVTQPAYAQAGAMVNGVIVDTTDPRSMRMAREAGFTHAKMVLYWPRLEPDPDHYLWNDSDQNDLDNVMRAAKAEGMALVLRVDSVPGWAGGSPGGADLGAVQRFYTAMAAHGRGTVVAYEILNEPNLPFEWGGPPDPAGYTAFLKAAYAGIKAADPSALVIGGGPSPNTGGFGGTIEDFDFLNGMYAAGARGYMDALGVHNYGGNTEPERDPADCGICFRRVEQYRALMVRNGDAGTPIWATEFGWLMDPGWGLGQYDWMKVSADQQADYIVRSYRYAVQNYPWMGGMLLSNLDASTSPYHTGPEDGLPWFAILNADYSPRPAWSAFQEWSRYQSALAASRAPAAAAPASSAASAASDEGASDADGGVSVRVAGTEGQGLAIRATPSTSGRRLALAPEGARLAIVGDDRQAEGRIWRNVKTANGATGWAAGEYLRGE